MLPRSFAARAETSVFDPTLKFIRPCNPITAKSVPAGHGWLHEPKLDGYRLQIVMEGRTVRLYSRRGNEWTGRLPALADALAAIPCRFAIIDASSACRAPVALRTFTACQRPCGVAGDELVVYAFDLLHRDGADLWRLPLTVRRRRLERLIARSKVPCLRLVECFDDGVKLLEAAERHQLEGIVSKRKASPYGSGESRDWRKIKTPTWRAANRNLPNTHEAPGRSRGAAHGLGRLYVLNKFESGRPVTPTLT